MADTTLLYQVSHGLQANYDAIVTKDEGTLYFCDDTQRIYRGAIKVADALQGSVHTGSTDSEAFPSSGQKQGVLYINTSTYEVKRWSGSSYESLSLPVETSLTKTADNRIPTSKAVADYVTDQFQQYVPENIVNNVQYKYVAETEGKTAPTLNVTKDGVPTDIPLNGVAYAPVWNVEEAKLTIPVVGGEAIVADIGKLSLVDSVSYDEASHTIIFTLNTIDPETSQHETIKVNITDFISTITGKKTDTVTVTINSGNEVQADVNIDDTEGNSLVVVPGKGLRVDVTGKLDKATPAASNDQVLLGDTTNGVKGSGKKVGGASFATGEDADTTGSILATEKAVAEKLAEKVDKESIVSENWNDVTDAQVPSALLVKTALAAKVDNSMVSSQIVNDDSKIPTSKAVYDALSWKTF